MALADELTPVDPDAHDERPSVLGSLVKRREEIILEQVLELKIPRWDNPEIVVVYLPVSYNFVDRIAKRMEKAKGPEKTEIELDSNADVLINHCQAIWAVIEGKRYSLRPDDEEGEPTRFDKDLAENLGLPEGATARQVVRTIFLTDGDMLSHARALGDWSGFALENAETAFAGES